MKISLDDLPQRIRVIENTWIPMPDGVRLAARIFLPEGAGDTPVPALFEMMPYRKRDFSRARDDAMHSYFAGHGYAVVRADVRGTGDSEGLLEDEYLPLEQDDAVAVLAWMRTQPWCNGRLGMVGLSWSGFSALQTAARRPVGLDAVIAVGATDDRYNSDIHYKGGLMLADQPMWDATFLPMCALPPDPEIVGESWKEQWLKRLEAREPWLPKWAAHQRRDEYWKQGSIEEDYAAIECPVYTVGGYSDGYIDPVFRLAENLTAPTKALVGPWPHAMPHEGAPGPAIGWLQEMVRWWNHWLKDDDTGIMDEPRMHIFVKDWQAPAGYVHEYDGRWIASRAWPSRDTQMVRLPIEKGAISSPLSVGLASGRWGAGGGLDDLPLDQRGDDAGSLCFDGEPLEAPLDVVGAARVGLSLTCDKPLGQLVVRLCDVAPDGTSLRLAWGVLNLTHRDGHESPVAVIPGEAMDIGLDLKHVAHRVPKGHRLRVALSTSYWPLVWPAPEAFTLSVASGHAGIPTWTGGSLEASPFGAPTRVGVSGYRSTRKGKVGTDVEVDEKTGEQVVTLTSDYGGSRIDVIGVETDIKRIDVLTIKPEDPCSAALEVISDYRYRQGDVKASISMHYEMGSTSEDFTSAVTLSVKLDGETFFSRNWQSNIKRDLM